MPTREGRHNVLIGKQFYKTKPLPHKTHNMTRSTHPLLQLLVMLAIALGLLLVTSAASGILIASGIDITTRQSMLWLQGITQIITFALPVLLIGIIYYRGQQRDFYRANFAGHYWLVGLAGVIIMLLLNPLNDWLSVWNESWDLGAVGEALHSIQDQTEGLLEELMDTTSVGGLLANLLVVALIPAVTEELFFRCGIQNLLQRWLRNPHVAIWLTAIIFSLGHGELYSFMPRLVMGATLGYLYIYGGSLVPNMLAHFANNAIVVVIYWLATRGTLDIDPNEPMHFGWTLTACCTIAALFLGYIVLLKNRKLTDSRAACTDGTPDKQQLTQPENKITTD